MFGPGSHLAASGGDGRSVVTSGMCRQRRGPDGPFLHIPQVTTPCPSPLRSSRRRPGRRHRPEVVCRVRASRDARQGSLLDDRAIPTTPMPSSRGRRGGAPAPSRDCGEPADGTGPRWLVGCGRLVTLAGGSLLDDRAVPHDAHAVLPRSSRRRPGAVTRRSESGVGTGPRWSVGCGRLVTLARARSSTIVPSPRVRRGGAPAPSRDAVSRGGRWGVGVSWRSLLDDGAAANRGGGHPQPTREGTTRPSAPEGR